MWVLRGPPRGESPGIRRPRIITPRAPDHYPPDVRKRVTWVGQPTRCRRSIPATRRSLDRTIRGVRVRSPGGNAARIDLRGGVRLHRVPNGLRRGSDRCPHRAVRGVSLSHFRLPIYLSWMGRRHCGSLRCRCDKSRPAFRNHQSTCAPGMKAPSIEDVIMATSVTEGDVRCGLSLRRRTPRSLNPTRRRPW